MRDKKKRSANQTALTAHHEWTDRTWNPTSGTGKVELVESKLTEPLHWRKPCRCFVNSMSDLFHEALSDEAIGMVFGVMARCPKHTFQILTKRAEHMKQWVGAAPIRSADRASIFRFPWPLPNVWLGVSVEDLLRKYRIELLRQTPAAVRFLSLEPLLEDIGELDLRGIHQVIIGGESGPGARPFNLEWARNIIRQSRAAGVALFLKQVGAHPYRVDDHHFISSAHTIYLKLKDRKGADMAEWPEWMRIREYPQSLSDSTSTARPR